MKQQLFHSSSLRHEKNSLILPVHDASMITGGASVVMAQDDYLHSMAFALANEAKSNVLAIGKIGLESHEPYIYMIFPGSAHVNTQMQGYIHEVDPKAFVLTPDNIGQKKWASKEPARVIEDPIPGTLKDVMQKIQIFVISGDNLIRELAENRPRQIPILARELAKPLSERRIEWLNQTFDVNPVRLPSLGGPVASELSPSTSG